MEDDGETDALELVTVEKEDDENDVAELEEAACDNDELTPVDEAVEDGDVTVDDGDVTVDDGDMTVDDKDVTVDDEDTAVEEDTTTEEELAGVEDVAIDGVVEGVEVGAEDDGTI